MARVEGLRAAGVFYWMGCLLGGPRESDIPPAEVETYRRERADAWKLWWPIVDGLRLDVRVESQARTTIERRFFAGPDVLFADATEAWTAHVDFVERLASLAETLASTGGTMARARPSTRTTSGSLTERIAERVATLTDDARVRAYEILGDRPRAVEIMERRLLAD
jgi:hypothetical protein